MIGLLIIGSASREAAAAEDAKNALPPLFNYWEEVWSSTYFKKLKKNKAYAIGLDNIHFYSYEFQSLRKARQEALEGCKDKVREKFGPEVETQCQLVMENDELVWRGHIPRPLAEDYLPILDVPLAKAFLAGNLSNEAQGIVLGLHGCDGLDDTDDAWHRSWQEFFVDRQFALVFPDSFMDGYEFVCENQTDSQYDSKVDEDVRLFVAQARRTLSKLHKWFPGKPIIIWGHSVGAKTAQILNYTGVHTEGIILTGASCYERMAGPPDQVLLHVFGSEDSLLFRASDSPPFTAEKIHGMCKDYSTTGAQRFVIVPKGDHWIPASEPSVEKALEEFLARLPK
jgi:pimeloyl-ACP methyl ester carboxylesterase